MLKVNNKDSRTTPCTSSCFGNFHPYFLKFLNLTCFLQYFSFFSLLFSKTLKVDTKILKKQLTSNRIFNSVNKRECVTKPLDK